MRVLAQHGALAGEQDRAQLFEVDVDVDLDMRRSGVSDDLADTLDYAAVVHTVSDVITDNRFQLLEALATAAAEALLGMERVGAVTVGVRKLHPPIAADLASVGVRIRRDARDLVQDSAGAEGGGAEGDRAERR